MIKFSKDGDTVTVSSKGARRGYTFVIATDATGFETRCEVTKDAARKHLADLHCNKGWR